MNYSVLRVYINQIIIEFFLSDVDDDLLDLFDLAEILTFTANTDEEIYLIYERVCNAIDSDTDLSTLNKDETLMHYFITQIDRSSESENNNHLIDFSLTL